MLFNNRIDYMATPKALSQLEKTNGFVESLQKRDDVVAVTWGSKLKMEEHLLDDGRFCSIFQVSAKDKSAEKKAKKEAKKSKKKKSKSSKSKKSSKDDDDEDRAEFDDGSDISLRGGSTTAIPKSAWQQYTLKCLDVNMNPKEFVFAAMDLLHEAGLLASMNHPNVIRLRGVCSDNLVDAYSDNTRRGYFFLYELMAGGSLRKKLSTWNQVLQKQQKQRSQAEGGGGSGFFLRRSTASTDSLKSAASEAAASIQNQQQRPSILGRASILSPRLSVSSAGSTEVNNIELPTLEERLKDVALVVAKAMNYLHFSSIAYRSLNPETGIGYDSEGKLYLCDMGLARKLQDGVGTLSTRGMNPFYKAPEYVLKEKQLRSKQGNGGAIDLRKADVFSFGLILYEIVTLTNPFEKYYVNVEQQQQLDVSNHTKHTESTNIDVETFEKEVLIGGERPSLDQYKNIPFFLKSLIISCWNENPNKRPCFSEIVKWLEEIIENQECPLSPVAVVKPSATIRKKLRSSSYLSTSLHGERRGASSTRKRYNSLVVKNL